MTRKALGKGLSSLFTEAVTTQNSEEYGVLEIGINEVDPNTEQPRRRFNDETLEELSKSIAKHGIMQPIIVKQNGNRYTIVAGERRWRAARLAKLSTVPVIVKELSNKESMEIALIENIQREDLNAIEEAEAYDKLMTECSLTQEQMAETLGKSRSAIANTVRLLSLEPYVRGLVADGAISSGHARALLGLKEKERQSEVAEYIVDNELNVRDVEKLIKTYNFPVKKAKENNEMKSSDIKKMEETLEEVLGTKVIIDQKSGNKGKVIIEYYSLEDFERIKEVIVK